MNKNSLLIAIVTGIIAVGLIVAIAVNSSSCGKSDSTQNGTVKATPAPIRVVKENGNQDAITKSKIELRMSKFGAKPKTIKAFEKKQKDTVDTPQTAKSQDGYLYLMYNFNDKKNDGLFGVKPASDTSAMVTYVFYKKHLTEVRYQYGKLDTNSYNKIVKNITKKYGNTTYNRDYSNSDHDNWWKTKKATLRALYSTGSVSVYFLANQK